MTDITIVQPHALSMAEARAAVQRAADEMTTDYEMVCTWQDNVLIFTRTGVSGTVALTENNAQLDMKLGIFLRTFAPKIREKVAGNMAKIFRAA